MCMSRATLSRGGQCRRAGWPEVQMGKRRGNVGARPDLCDAVHTAAQVGLHLLECQHLLVVGMPRGESVCCYRKWSLKKTTNQPQRQCIQERQQSTGAEKSRQGGGRGATQEREETGSKGVREARRRRSVNYYAPALAGHRLAGRQSNLPAPAGGGAVKLLNPSTLLSPFRFF